MSDVIELNDVNFDTEVFRSSQPVLVDFYATWCGPCKKQLPVMDEMAKDYSGRIRVAKLNVDEEPNRAAEYGIGSIPSLLVFKNGQIVERMVGLHSQSQLSDIVRRHL